MYDLIQVGENTYYIESPVNVGIYVDSTKEEKEAWIIDTGLDLRMGKRIAKHLQANGWKPKAIINTHCHADHIGSNAYLQKEFGIPAYSNGMDCRFIENTILSPMALWGSYPPKVLQTPLFKAPDSSVRDISEADLPQDFEVINFPGHSLYMIGLRTPDDIVFTADMLCSPFVFEKYGIAFNYHAAGYFRQLDEAEKLEAKLFVPAHGEPFTDIKALTEINRKAVLSVKNLIAEICRTPHTFDELIQALFNHYNIPLTLGQYAVTGSTVRSYLTWLYDEGIAEPLFENNLMRWHTKQ